MMSVILEGAGAGLDCRGPAGASARLDQLCAGWPCATCEYSTCPGGMAHKFSSESVKLTARDGAGSSSGRALPTNARKRRNASIEARNIRQLRGVGLEALKYCWASCATIRACGSCSKVSRSEDCRGIGVPHRKQSYDQRAFWGKML